MTQTSPTTANFTESQRLAIEAKGNVLVVAGAGAGKTKTLVQRCVSWLLADPGHSLDKILMVTFTEAAASEMRQRIRDELQKQLAAQPDNHHLVEQIALLDTAFISTLHGFCLQLIRQHFYVLELDPQIAVMPQEEAQLLEEGTLLDILNRHYVEETPASEGVRELVQSLGRGWDRPVRRLVLKLHHYAQTLPNPSAWIKQQLEMFQAGEPTHWRSWLREGVREWCEASLSYLRAEAAENELCSQCALALARLNEHSTFAEMAEAFQQIVEFKANAESMGGKRKKKVREPTEAFFADVEFWRSLLCADGKDDPLAEDWNWVRPGIITLLQLTDEFGQEFARSKRELGVVDFHDLEQYSLRLLWDDEKNGPTPLAEHWRRRLDLIFVDEYQDINAAQDAMLTALGREPQEGNRFLVGDVKQSIYRFRLAAPHIFQNYARLWCGQAELGSVIPLSDNFRSHEALLAFINPLFADLMRREVGGVEYDQTAWLRFGNPDGRTALRLGEGSATGGPRVELHLRLTGKSSSEEGGSGEDEASDANRGSSAELTSAEMEARLVALRLLEMKVCGHLIWDERERRHRAVEWNDMVVLLRSPRSKVESYAKEFARLNIPLAASRGGFFESPEIMDLLHLLALLDNPLQDAPTLAVLRSPLVGLTANELAAIRLTMKGRYWTAVLRFHDVARRLDGAVSENAAPAFKDAAWREAARSGWPKVDIFLRRFSKWRRLIREASLSQCLEQILNDTQYAAWLLTQPRGEARRANIPKLLNWARQFDQFRPRGLYQFLKFIEAQKEAEIDHEPAPLETEKAVRLMSIHQSKGLEFPVVVLGDLGKPFNFLDLTEEVILDEKFGLCPKIKPPATEQRYPSLTHWLAQKRQRQEALGEEMRLLYVAMTRACYSLILVGTFARKKAEKEWMDAIPEAQALRRTVAAKCFLDWLGPWLMKMTGQNDWFMREEGRAALVSWKIYEDQDARLEEDMLRAGLQSDDGAELGREEKAQLRALKKRLNWQYPYLRAAAEPAKSSVSTLRRKLAEIDGEASLAPFVKQQRAPHRPRSNKGQLTAAEAGTAHHAFLQFVSLEQVGSLEEIQAEADALVEDGVMTEMERSVLKLDEIAEFWSGPVGQRIRERVDFVNREMPFTARLAFPEMKRFGLIDCDPGLADEFVIVQGVIDLVVLLPDEIWVLDFKTDHVTLEDCEEKARTYLPQLHLYQFALSRIYRRPVTASWLHFLAIGKTVDCLMDE